MADIRRVVQIAVLDTLGLENSIARSRTLDDPAAKLLETGELEERIAAPEAAIHSQGALRPPVFGVEPSEDEFTVEEQS